MSVGNAFIYFPGLQDCAIPLILSIKDKLCQHTLLPFHCTFLLPPTNCSWFIYPRFCIAFCTLVVYHILPLIPSIQGTYSQVLVLCNSISCILITSISYPELWGMVNAPGVVSSHERSISCHYHSEFLSSRCIAICLSLKTIKKAYLVNICCLYWVRKVSRIRHCS